jgi:hypothetical protein
MVFSYFLRVGVTVVSKLGELAPPDNGEVTGHVSLVKLDHAR